MIWFYLLMIGVSGAALIMSFIDWMSGIRFIKNELLDTVYPLTIQIVINSGIVIYGVTMLVFYLRQKQKKKEESKST